jgi:hypothetical protein
MNADHEKVARPDARGFTSATRAVQRAELADNIVVPDFEETRLALELHVLRLAAHDGMLVNPIARAQPRKTLDYCIRSNLTIWANFDVIFDNSCGMYRHLQGFEDNRVLWILQILFIMLGGFV